MNKKIALFVLITALLMQTMTISAFADNLTLSLSKSSGSLGQSVKISGTCNSDEWITIKATDSDGNIIYIKPVLAEDDGTYSTVYIVPDINYDTLTFTVGCGSDVVSTNFTVRHHKSSDDDDSSSHSSSSSGGSSYSSGSGSSSPDSKETTITNSEGTTITGTVEETENGYDVTIDGNDFRDASGGNVIVSNQYVEITFDEKAAKYISNAAGSGSIVLSILNAGKSSLPDKVQKLIGDRPAYEFKLSADGSNLSTFGGGLAYVSIPYILADDEEVNRVVIYYISDDGKLNVLTNSTYDGTSVKDKFSTRHFSIYAVGYNDISFNDVAKSDWYYDVVIFCSAREITSGIGNNLFDPNGTLTRGQFMVMLMRAYGIKASEGITDNFSDAGDMYYTTYLAEAKRLGIASGVGNNLFAPESNITRQDMFTLLYRALDVLGELPETARNGALTDFSDANEIADYAKEGMETFADAGIVSGSYGKLDPMGNSTRAQMTQVLYNLITK